MAHIAAKNQVVMLERDGNLICKSLRSAVLFVQIATFLFGTGLTAGVWYSLTHPEAAKMPWFWTGLMALLGFVCCAVFVRNIFGTPRFEVSGVMDASGKCRPLCASPDSSLIRVLAEKMAAMTQRPVEEGA